MIKFVHKNSLKTRGVEKNSGVSLIELIVFIVVVSIALAALVGVYIQSSTRSIDPIIHMRLLEAAQSRLDEVLALKFDEATPSGGIPACNSTSAPACTQTPDANMNDVDDFHNVTDQPYPAYNRVVSVSINGDNKLITVRVTAPNNDTVTLSAYRYNF